MVYSDDDQDPRVLFLFLFLLPTAIHSHYIQEECCSNFARNEVLQSNINNVLLDMVARTSVHGFAISSSGESYNEIFGVTRCRGDIIAEECSACIARAAQRIRRTCPDGGEARIWYEHCFLRYETSNFLGRPDPSRVEIWNSCTNVSTDPQAFDRVVGELLGEVTAQAVNGSTRFGWAEGFDADNKIKLYGMAQCTRDLEGPACRQCLDKALDAMAECKHYLGCYAITNSCILRFEDNLLIFDPDYVDGLGIFAPAPAPSPTSN